MYCSKEIIAIKILKKSYIVLEYDYTRKNKQALVKSIPKCVAHLIFSIMSEGFH